MLRGIVIALCLVGCLRDPKFTPRDAPTDDDTLDADPDAHNEICPAMPNVVGVTPRGTGARVCGPNYHFEFSADGAHFPYQLNVAGTALMASGTRCNDERAMGMALFPSIRVNGENTPMITSTLGIDLGGANDAIAKVELDWTAGHACSSNVGVLGSRTTFTFFPDGRVHRFDRTSHSTTLSSGNCPSCEASTNGEPFYLTSYATIAGDLGGVAIVGATGGDHTTLDMEGESIAAGDDACITTRQRHVAFGWDSATLGAGTRVRAARLPQTGVSGAYAFVFDQLNAASMITSTNAFNEIQTTMLLGDNSTSCALLLGLMPEYTTTPPAMQIERMGEAPGPLYRGLDGIYGGETAVNPGGGFDVPGAPGVPIILSMTSGTTRSFAVWLELAQFHPSFTLTRNPPAQTTNWYRMQRTTSGTDVVFWFPGGLAVGETITIDPN